MDEPWSWRRDQDRLNQYFMKYLHGRNEDDGIAEPPSADLGRR